MLFTLIVLHLVAAAPSMEGEYVPLARLEELSCVTAWEQLCSASGNSFPSVTVEEKQVVVRPFMDDSELAFEVKRASPTVLELRGSHDGAALTATLTLTGSVLVWSGANVAEVLRGSAGAKTTLKLVKQSRVSALHQALTAKLVPGGECEGLMAAEWPKKKERCLNTKDGKAAPVDLK